MIRNLTAQPVVVYPADAPDVITTGDIAPICVYDRDDYSPAWIREVSTEIAHHTDDITSPAGTTRIPIYDLTHYPAHIAGLPEPGADLFIVPKIVALAAEDRNDLIVVHREVRNRRGSVIGCRAFARVTRARTGEPLPAGPATAAAE